MENIMAHTGLTRETLRKMWLGMLSLSIYRNVLKRPVTAALCALLEAAAREEEPEFFRSWGALCALLAQKNRLNSLPGAMAEEVLADDNRFSAALSAKEQPDHYLRIWRIAI
ncbi:MAG: hypothetical protein ACLSS9_10780 [Acutalibacteraceae bacterium]